MTIEPFKHHILVGHMADAEQWKISLTASRVFVTVHWDGEELHFTGVEGPKRNGDAHGSCGQIEMHWRDDPECWTYGSPDMPRERVKRLMELWDRWHLNHMKAGCEHQRADGWDKRPIDPTKPLNTYGKHFPGQRQDSWNMLTWVRPDEHPEGLLTVPCPECGYKYGTAWLREEVPHDVLVELLTYPTSDKLPDRWQ